MVVAAGVHGTGGMTGLSWAWDWSLKGKWKSLHGPGVGLRAFLYLLSKSLSLSIEGIRPHPAYWLLCYRPYLNHVFSFLPISSRHGLSYDSSLLCITNLLRGDLHPNPNHLLLESKPVPFRNWIVVPGRLISKPPAWKSLIFKHTSLQSRRKLHASAFLLKSVELTKITISRGKGFCALSTTPKVVMVNPAIAELCTDVMCLLSETSMASSMSLSRTLTR